jgi:hypothetical protein
MIDVNDEAQIQAFRQQKLRDGMEPGLLDAYLGALVVHIRYVQEAGRMIGVGFEQLMAHDQSKFSEEEFEAYAEQHWGSGENDAEYALAWLHHLHLNPHHWNHWIFPKDFTPEGANVENGVARMPEHFALEMAADWMGANKAYQDTWDVGAWLSEKMSTIWLHSETAEYLNGVLTDLGYGDVVAAGQWAHELGSE